MVPSHLLQNLINPRKAHLEKPERSVGRDCIHGFLLQCAYTRAKCAGACKVGVNVCVP